MVRFWFILVVVLSSVLSALAPASADAEMFRMTRERLRGERVVAMQIRMAEIILPSLVLSPELSAQVAWEIAQLRWDQGELEEVNAYQMYELAYAYAQARADNKELSDLIESKLKSSLEVVELGKQHALNELRDHSRAYPDFSKRLTVLIELGTREHEMGNRESALRVFKEVRESARATRGEFTTACLRIGMIHFETGEYEVALQHFDEVLPHSEVEDYGWALYYRALSLARLGRTAQAHQAWQRVLHYSLYEANRRATFVEDAKRELAAFERGRPN